MRESPEQPSARPPPHRPLLLADGGRLARLALPAGFGALALPHHRAGAEGTSVVVTAAADVVLDDVLEGPRGVRIPNVLRLALLRPVTDGLQVGFKKQIDISEVWRPLDKCAKIFQNLN